MAWIKTCPSCGGPVNEVREGWAKGLFECGAMEKASCDRFFTADEVAVSR